MPFDPNKPFDVPKPKFDSSQQFTTPGQVQAQQQAGPQPFQPAANQDKLQQMFHMTPESQAFRQNVDSEVDSGRVFSQGYGAPATASGVVGGIGSILKKTPDVVKGIASLFMPKSAKVAQMAGELLPEAESGLGKLGASGARELTSEASPGLNRLVPRESWTPREAPVELGAKQPFIPKSQAPQPIEPPVELGPTPARAPRSYPKPIEEVPEQLVLKDGDQFSIPQAGKDLGFTPAGVAAPPPMKQPPLGSLLQLIKGGTSSMTPAFKGADPASLSIEQLMTPEAQHAMPGLMDMLLKARIK